MKKKTLIVIVAVVAVAAIFSAVAYAWFTSQSTLSGNSVTTGKMAAEVGVSPDPITTAGLMPGDVREA